MKKHHHAAVAASLLALATAAMADPRDVGPNTNATYVKECGACHFPYQPALMPARSWRKVMSNLGDHFGETAELKVSDRDSLTAYLVAGAAETADNQRSRELLATLPPGDTPTRVTGILYVGGIHGGFLDPKFKGIPNLKTLANCAACHPKADEGRYAPRVYVVTDELFRVLSGDYNVGF